jgi:cell division protein FtsX
MTAAASAGQTTSLAGAAEADRKDFGPVPADDFMDQIDASVFLLTTDPGRQEAIRRQLAALPVVQQFAYESQAAAFKRYRVMFRNQPQRLRGVTQRAMPASFRVVLHDPRQYSELFRAFCPQLGPDGKPACVEGVEAVVDQHQVTWDGLAGPWLHTTDAAVFLTSGADPGQQEMIRRDLEALAVVAQVDFESKAAALRRLRQQGVTDPVVLHDYALDSFRVRLREPKQFPALYGRLCSGRWSLSTEPVCVPGVRLVIANPRSVYFGLKR